MVLLNSFMKFIKYRKHHKNWGILIIAVIVLKFEQSAFTKLGYVQKKQTK